MLSNQSLFTPERTPYDHFKEELNRHCASIGASDLVLTENEVQQLSWLVGNTFVTPESRAQSTGNRFNFEVQRAIARRYSFELLIKGDEASYQKFIAQQTEPKLKLEDFNSLSQEANALSADAKVVIRLGCLLTPSDKARTLLTDKNPAYDSEEFMTQLAGWINASAPVRELFPIVEGLSANQLQLLPKMYWPNTHLRAMLQTEGGDNMTASFRKGIQDGKFKEADFPVLKWRWLTVACGFAAGSGAKYYDANIHFLTQAVNTELEKCFFDKEHMYLDSYLLFRAEKAGLRNDQANLVSKYFFGHLVAFSNQVHVINDTRGAIVYDAYMKAQQELLDHSRLATEYHSIRTNPEAVTPTYVTSVYSTAYFIIFNDEKTRNGDEAKASETALSESTQFICYIMAALFKQNPAQKVSMQALAQKDNLLPVLTAWRADHSIVEFQLNERLEMTAAIQETRPTLRMI